MAALRRLQDLTVSTNPGGSLWADAAAHLESACAILDGHQVPETDVGRRPGAEHARAGPSADAAVDVTDSGPDGVTMAGHFTEAHIGGNRAVHGGMIPLLYDWLFGMTVTAAEHPADPDRIPARRLPQDHPDRRATGGPRHDHRDRRPESFHQGYYDIGRRRGTQRSQRPDGSLASAPAVKVQMSDTAVEFTVPAVTAAVAAAIPDRELIIQGDRRYTYAEIMERSQRLAAYLHSRGLGCHTERSALDGHEVGQDLVGLYAYNGNEFVESLLGAFAARVAPFNVNFRYVKSELQYLLADSGATALIYHAAFAPRVAEVLPDLPQLRVLIQIADDSGNALLDGAVDYEDAISSELPDAGRPALPRRPVRALHRRHDRDAERRAVASARHLHDVVRRAQHDDRRAQQLARRDRGTAGRHRRHQADDRCRR